MWVSVDEGSCDGCGLCVRCAPEVFRQAPDLLARVRLHPVPPAFHEAVLEAMDVCPEACIERHLVPPPDAMAPAGPIVLDATLGDPVEQFRRRYPGSAFTSVVRVELTDDQLRIWTAAGSYHEVPRGTVALASAAPG